jgi:hypothetical protein
MTDQDTGSPLIEGNQVGPGCSHHCIDFKRSTGMLIKGNTGNCSGTVTVNGQTYPACNANNFYTEQGNSSFTETGTFEENVIYGAAPGYACLGANLGSTTVGPTSVNYYNNTCYAGSTGMVAYYAGNCMGGTIHLYNNIFYGGTINTGSNCSIIWDYNNKYGTSGGPSGAHDMNVNPLFVNPSALDFHLQSTSPLLNSGYSSILGHSYMGACGTSGSCP